MNKLLIIISCILGFLSAAHAQDLDKIIASHENVIIEFMKPSCPYSQYLNPIFSYTMKQYPNPLVIFKVVDISSNQDYYKNHFGFSTVPTVIYYKNGKKVKMHGSNNMSIKSSHLQNNIESIYGIKPTGGK